MLRVVIGVAALLVLVGCAQPVQFASDGRGGLAADSPGQLFKPDGAGPFPAVVVLHGCGGLAGNHRVWARRLNGWGYAALVIDSFGPRDVKTVCATPLAVTPDLRARDAFAGAAWLASQPFIRADRIAVIGFSHGGSTVLKAVQQLVVDAAGARPFRAAVAYYPGCRQDFSRLVTETLILIGEADDWTTPNRCVDYAAARAGETPGLTLKLYPGTYHAFDSRGPERYAYGHKLVHNPAAAEDSFVMTRQFLDARLK
ncbi:MAG: dienelactone hydrolase family protein [Proteobacteria bacterium]|nr:dienelactone hydrolase family protein [Pseudomonadota bacterium]